MKPPSARKKRGAWHVAKLGRVKVPVYKRQTPLGNPAYMVANYSNGKRRFDSYADPDEAQQAAAKLARQLSEQDVLTASMTREQSIEYASTVQILKPLGITLPAAASAVAEALKVVAGLADIQVALRFYAARRKQTTAKRVVRVVAELLKVKKARQASARYLTDLRFRLKPFASDFKRDIGNVTTADIQEWMDGKKKLSSQSYENNRRVLHLLFKFAVARGYASDNPVGGVEKVKVRNGEIQIFTPLEITRLLAAASPEFLPVLAIGAFAGLRSAEIERLEWSDIHLTERHIVVGKDKAKTASRRIVPISDNLAAWLATYSEKQGKVWQGQRDALYKAMVDTAAATRVEADTDKGIKAQSPVAWKANGLRHSFASYRFAQIADAGRVAAELGNSAAVVHRHYRELVTPKDAVKWFAVTPEDAPVNVVTIAGRA
jgi:integrase